MPKGYPSLAPEQKREIVSRIKEKGGRVADLAKEYGVSPRIIYGYLSCSGQNSGTLLELSKLKREKDALLKIVGQLIVDQKLGKKIQRRYGHSFNLAASKQKEFRHTIGCVQTKSVLQA